MLVGQQLGPFLVEKEIGAGAMGAVYRARYTKNNQLVAIKLMSPSLGSSNTALARFEREAAILKQLNHPNIVRLYATGHFRRAPFYAMEFVDGEPLDRILQRKGRLIWEEVVTLGQQLCAGLQHAHEMGIVHRDIKPSNLMILPDGTLKLTDFGIARDLDVTRLTSTHSTVGTAAYMSPEQCRGEANISLKSDLYSMGVVFYELLTGSKPFQAETPLEMFQLHVSGTFERPSRRVLEIPIWLDTLVCQLLEKSPDQRPRDAGAVAEALGRIVDRVTAQQSAGVEAVKERAIDRPRTAPRPDEDDREAARELRAALGKKRGKRKGLPFYRQIWFALAGVVLVLVLIAGVLVVAIRPPAAERLHRQAQKLMESKDPDDWIKARTRDGPIPRYLRYYGDRDDEMTRQVRAWADQVDVQQRERALANRLRLKLAAEGPAEPIARRAVELEEAGDLAGARERWQALQKHRNDADPEQRPWALVADKRLRELKEVEEREQRLLDLFDAEGKLLPGYKPASDLERLAVEAVQNELLKKLPAAREGWIELRQKCEKQPEQRVWVLLAAKKLRELAEEK
jgi:serine/threonine-protein kinase